MSEKKCFSCGQGQPKSIVEMLLFYQKEYENTGKVFYFYKQNENDKIQITDANDFKKILPKLKKNKTAEWSHIADFRES